MMKKCRLILLFVLVGGRVLADEGMWLLPLIEQLNLGKMQKMGLELSAGDIYSINKSSIKDAIGIFGPGCTGEVISNQGLILTNHHCGFDAIQYHSAVEHDYLEEGFWAANYMEELYTPNLAVTFLVRMEDVTDAINIEVDPTMNEQERARVIRRVSARIEEDAKKDNHYTASVRNFFGGNKYYLLVYERYEDVRLVGTPPSSIGKFGSDTDNWEWPRHTGDFALFRVYMSPDGRPAKYAPENIPLQPRHHLPISLNGYQKGDFAFVMGFPGRTQRYLTSHGVKEMLDITHPNRIKIRGIRQEILMGDMLADDKVKIQYATKYYRSSNYWKYSIGQSKGLKRLNVVDKKAKQEQVFAEWVAGNEDRVGKYGDVLPKIAKLYAEREVLMHVKQYSDEIWRSIEVFALADQYRGLYQLMKFDPDSLDARNQMVAELKSKVPVFFKDYNPSTDKKVGISLVELYASDVDPLYHPAFFTTIQKKFKGNTGKYIDDVFKRSIFASQEKLEQFLTSPSTSVLEKDPAFLASQSIFNVLVMVYPLFEINSELASAERLYIQGIMEMYPDSAFYPDANFSMRLTYGKVGDYSPRDGVHYLHSTTLEGVMEKEDPSNPEFVVPEKLKELHAEGDYGPYSEEGIMPVCFITNNDITGGNSGSPVMNGKGELIGLAFDGNWEAMSGDIAFEPDLQRCINVDIRYVLFVIDKFAGATHLVDEMTLITR